MSNFTRARSIFDHHLTTPSSQPVPYIVFYAPTFFYNHQNQRRKLCTLHNFRRFIMVFACASQFSDQTTTSNWTIADYFSDNLAPQAKKQTNYRYFHKNLQPMEQILPRVSSISLSSFFKNCDKSTVAVPPILMEMQDKRPVSPVPPYGGGLFLIYPPANCTKKRVIFYLVRERETVCLAAKLQDGLF